LASFQSQDRLKSFLSNELTKLCFVWLHVARGEVVCVIFDPMGRLHRCVYFPHVQDQKMNQAFEGGMSSSAEGQFSSLIPALFPSVDEAFLPKDSSGNALPVDDYLEGLIQTWFYPGLCFSGS
jgi:hypothetical protein